MIKYKKSKVIFIALFMCMISIGTLTSCQKNDGLSLVGKLNNDKELLQKIKFDNKSTYFGYTIHIAGTKKPELNVNIKSQNEMDSVTRQTKLKKESTMIMAELNPYRDQLSVFSQVNFYLFSNSQTIDTLIREVN